MKWSESDLTNRKRKITTLCLLIHRSQFRLQNFDQWWSTCACDYLKYPYRTGDRQFQAISWLCSSHCSCLSLLSAAGFCLVVDGRYHSFGSGDCDDEMNCGRLSSNGMEYFLVVYGSAVSCASSLRRCARTQSLYLEWNGKQTQLLVIIIIVLSIYLRKNPSNMPGCIAMQRAQ